MNCSFVGFSLPDIPMCHCKGGSGEDEGWRPLQSTTVAELKDTWYSMYQSTQKSKRREPLLAAGD
jgi:hypothetical protein